MKRNLIFTIAFTVWSYVCCLAQSTEIRPGNILPKMTTAQRTALASPADGMLVFDSNTQSYWYRKSGVWENLTGGTGSSYWSLNGSAGNEIKNTNVGGFWSSNSVGLSYGSTNITNPPAAPVNGLGTRMMWIPSRSAFRVGTVSEDYWDAANIGLFSFGSGFDSKASGKHSVAMGVESDATGLSSTAFGYFTSASGTSSTAMGEGTIANGFASTALGLFNNPNLNGLLMVGNGTGPYPYTNFIIRRDNNRVGIGTETPEAPLHVVGNAGITQSFAFFASNSSFAPITGAFPIPLGPIDVSIKTSNRILATEFNAYSDARHKTIKARKDGRSALSNILKLAPTAYTFIDVAAKGHGEKLGFIAQEVEEIMPLAVSKTTDFIPNVYALASSFNHDLNHNTLSISLSKEHDFKVGDEVKIMTNAEEVAKVIEIVNDKTFILSNIAKKPEGVFVFGKKVDDFRVVDYDHIFTMGIGAIQALAKENEEMKKKIFELEKLKFRIEIIEASLNQSNPVGK
jgi:hypothetical protein